jgi:hypothetical protein
MHVVAMNEVKGPISALGGPFLETLAEVQRLPPNKQALAMATFGAFTVTACGYVAVTLGPFAAAFPASAITWWTGIAAFGLLLVAVGVRGARGPVATLEALWTLAVLIGGGWLIATYAPSIWANYYGRGFCVSMIGAGTVRLFVTLRGVRGDALKMVKADIAAKEFSWDEEENTP